MLRITLSILTISIYFACTPLPKKRFHQFQADFSHEIVQDSLQIHLKNPLACPLRVKLVKPNPQANELLAKDFPYLLEAHTDTVLSYACNHSKEELDLTLGWIFGNPIDSITPDTLTVPFPVGKKYKIIQGYQGDYSHNTDYSRYALDFGMQVGDTVCSVADGHVIGVIEGYKDGGSSRKWIPYANFITLYHPNMKIYTQYVHLNHMGSMVEVGDSVQKGDPIGLSGMTGYTNVSHLHFNVLRSTENSMQSIPVWFGGGIDGHTLKEGIWVNNQ